MNYKSILFVFYIFIWIALAISPWYREDWLLENVLVFISLPIIVWAERRVSFSAPAATMLFLFFVLHAIGAHYTYSEMPWFSPITEMFGFERNHFDRLTHFMFGFLLFVPYYELFFSFFHTRKGAMALTFFFLIAASGVYEVLEWIATQMTHADLGVAFLGIQGDTWDAQKDMAFGYLGALLAAVLWWPKIARR